MGYDEAFRSVLVSKDAHLSLRSNHITLTQGDLKAQILLKDIHTIILESNHIQITSSLLSALAKHNIVLLTCDEGHLINGIFQSFHGHFQSAKIAREQIAVSKQKKSILWQKIIKNKIFNQAKVLESQGKLKIAQRLNELSKNVKLGDSTNLESQAAALYFKALFGRDFSRNEFCFINSALNYGYAIIRSCIVRNVCASGLLSSFGIKHDNVYNSFNLCDDLIEVFRPCVDMCVFELGDKKDAFLDKEDKRILIEILQQKATIEGQQYPLNRVISRYVQSFRNALLGDEELSFVVL